MVIQKSILMMVVLSAVNSLAYLANGQFIVERVGGDYTEPSYVTQPPGDFNNLFIVERGDGSGGLGRIARRDQAANTTSTFLDFEGTVTQDGGVISIAFHPQFQTNGLFYVVLMDSLTNSALEYQANPGNLNQTPTLNRTLLTYSNAQAIHTIDWLGFRPGTNELFLTTGDGGPQVNSGSFDKDLIESTLSPYGKVMRFDLSQSFDPAPSTTAHPGIDVFAIGLRNPYRASFCPDGGMFLGDVGFTAVEEINYIPATHFASAANPPVDFGWADREGTISTVTGNPEVSGVKGPNDIDPIFDYLHPGINAGNVGFPHTSVITGRCIVAGCEFQGRFYFADFNTEAIYSGVFNTGLDPTQFDGTNLTDIQNHTVAFETELNDDIDRVSSFGMDNVGNLYFVDFGGSGETGEVFRLVSTLPVEVVPNSYQQSAGIYVSGGLAELLESDDADLTIRNFGAGAVEITVKAISPVTDPSSLEITLECAVAPLLSNVTQTIEIYDYDAESWVEVDSRRAERLNDGVVDVEATGDVSRFVESGTNCVEARIRFISTNPRRRFTSTTDQIKWTITP